jgi:hypothetical protein
MKSERTRDLDDEKDPVRDERGPEGATTVRLLVMVRHHQ